MSRRFKQALSLPPIWGEMTCYSSFALKILKCISSSIYVNICKDCANVYFCFSFLFFLSLGHWTRFLCCKSYIDFYPLMYYFQQQKNCVASFHFLLVWGYLCSCLVYRISWQLRLYSKIAWLQWKNVLSAIPLWLYIVVMSCETEFAIYKVLPPLWGKQIQWSHSSHYTHIHCMWVKGSKCSGLIKRKLSFYT